MEIGDVGGYIFGKRGVWVGNRRRLRRAPTQQSDERGGVSGAVGNGGTRFARDANIGREHRHTGGKCFNDGEAVALVLGGREQKLGACEIGERVSIARELGEGIEAKLLGSCLKRRAEVARAEHYEASINARRARGGERVERKHRTLLSFKSSA